MLRRRHRTGPYPLAQTRSPLKAIVPLLGGIVFVLLLLWAGKEILSILHIGNAVQRTAVILLGDSRGSVSVSLNGEEPRSADSELKLYPGDSVNTDRGSPAALELFDGTTIRIDRGSALTIDDSTLGAVESSFAIVLDRGVLWIKTPESFAFSGSVARSITTQRYTAEIPSGTEAYFSDSLIEIYTADGVGVTFRIPELRSDLVAGEGQRFVIPAAGTDIEDAYAGRGALSTDFIASPFVLESRSLHSTRGISTTDTSQPEISQEMVTITEPEDGSIVRSATVTVFGTFSSLVDAIRVNGYRALSDTVKGTYSIEIAVPDEEEISITAEALSREGLVLGKAVSTVQRDRTPPEKPVVLSPAPDGAEYRTSKDELEISGTAPRGTAGIIVNDYRLQLFQTGDTKWSYLASTKLQNFAQGENIFRIVAISESGYRSEPAVLTIVLGEGEEGVISGGTPSAAPTPGSLPNNAPLKPGTLIITAPTPGTRHDAVLTSTGAEFLIEGNVPAGTASVWVNDYKLQLYSPGKGFFNYIASTRLNTLRRGENPYVIITRDKEGNILDRVQYTIVLSRE
ncbi:MAG: Uncharacterized protein Greene041662_916 [Candidatus Peregrinibacteria bacterium Greene0416_62]|nr:MAG: Uncharacterized protein Greene041662_916 [Candidatus Peregrinibacteria bacterium Greene0416_62]TSC98149.1 MAG: Uncharacterized protein Greene101449_1005 [Candidatus Peregrinibacteria bacterium Greene1014_49]